MIFATLLVTSVLGQVELPVTDEPLERLQGISSSLEDERRRQTIKTNNNHHSSFAVNNVGVRGHDEGTYLDTSNNFNSHFYNNNDPYIQNGGGRQPITNMNNPFNNWFNGRRRFERFARQMPNNMGHRGPTNPRGPTNRPSNRPTPRPPTNPTPSP